MLATQPILTFLKKNGASTFDEIWKAVKSELMMSISKEMNEAAVKADLHFSMTEDQRIIMVGGNKWNLAGNFSWEETQEIQRKILGEELEKVTLIEDDTKEIKLELEEIKKEEEE